MEKMGTCFAPVGNKGERYALRKNHPRRRLVCVYSHHTSHVAKLLRVDKREPPSPFPQWWSTLYIFYVNVFVPKIPIICLGKSLIMWILFQKQDPFTLHKSGKLNSLLLFLEAAMAQVRPARFSPADESRQHCKSSHVTQGCEDTSELLLSMPAPLQPGLLPPPSLLGSTQCPA